MTTRLHEEQRAKWSRYGFQNLLAWLFLFLMVRPFLAKAGYADVVFSGFLSLVLLSAAYAVNSKSRLFAPALFLVTLSLALLWLSALNVLHWPAALTSGLFVLYLGMLVYSFGRQLFAVRRVDANVICAALCLYLIIGILWGAIFGVLESLAPGSFAGKLLSDAGSAQEVNQHLYYFSFVTLSTLGYGDITPQTEGAAALCQTEAILGQFFALVLVARLVGIQIAQEGNRES